MNAKKSIILALVLVVLAAAFTAVYFRFSEKPVEGAKTVCVDVVDDQGQTKSYQVHTDAEYLRQVLEQADGLTVEGQDGDYGLMVEKVNGISAVYEKDQAYWAFYVNGDYCNYGIDDQPVEDGDLFTVKYEKAQ